jgi:hypothetical protein
VRRLRLTPRRVAVLLAATVGISAGVAYAATLSVGSWHLWAGSQTLTKATCTLTGTTQTSDTYVSSAAGSTGTNFGGTATMLVQPNTTAKEWAFVSFTLSSCSPTIPTTGGADTATLKLTITSTPTGGRTLTVNPVLGSWTETGLTWTSAQSLSYGPTTTQFPTGTTANATLSIPVTLDVDALIKNPSASFGWRISDGGSQATGDTSTFATSENGTSSRHPQLVINYEK